MTHTHLHILQNVSLFEDEFYLKSQIAVLKETLELFIAKYNPKAIPKED